MSRTQVVRWTPVAGRLREGPPLSGLGDGRGANGCIRAARRVTPEPLIGGAGHAGRRGTVVLAGGAQAHEARAKLQQQQLRQPLQQQEAGPARDGWALLVARGCSVGGVKFILERRTRAAFVQWLQVAGITWLAAFCSWSWLPGIMVRRLVGVSGIWQVLAAAAAVPPQCMMGKPGLSCSWTKAHGFGPVGTGLPHV